MRSKNNLITGLSWSFLDLLSRQGLQLFIQIILARLLLPSDFGLIGMVTIFIAISTSLVQSGMDQALIREKTLTEKDYSTVFIYNLLISIMLYLIIFISAPFIAGFYNEPQLVSVQRVLMLVIIFNALSITQRVVLIRDLNFKLQTQISITANIISAIVSITLAIVGAGVWSLVAQQVVLRFIEAVLLVIFNRQYPKLLFDKVAFKKYFTFGYRLTLSGLLNTVYDNSYFVIIGKLYNINLLGYYTNANKLKDAITQSFTGAIQKVTYPILSQQQEHTQQLSNNYIKLIKMTAFLMFPIMFGVAALAPNLIPFLLGEQWKPSVIYFQLLSIAGMLYPIHAINLNILKVKNRSDLFLKLEIVKKLFLTLFIIIAVIMQSGVIGIIYAAIAGSISALFINTYYSAKEINYTVFKQIKDILPSFLISLIMATTVHLLGKYLTFNTFFLILVEIIAGVILYTGLSRLFKLKELKIIMNLLKGLKSK